MKPPRDDKQRPNYPVIIVGLLFALWGLYALFARQISNDLAPVARVMQR
jgi:hypothetical protein